MNNPFTVEETNLMCVFETSNRMKLMEEIRRVMLHIKDSDMEELAGQVLRKLDGMTDKEFLKQQKNSGSKWVGSRLQWLATCFLFYNHKIDCEKSLDKL